jgi:DNA repair protein RadA/Sms
MVLAVLEARCGVRIGANDVYLNIAGGLRISEPAADLAVAAALLSSLTGEPVPAETVVFGEIGLTGEVRTVSQTEARLKEATKLGFAGAILPRPADTDGPAGAAAPKRLNRGPELREIARLDELIPLFGEPGAGRGHGG